MVVPIVSAFATVHFVVDAEKIEKVVRKKKLMKSRLWGVEEKSEKSFSFAYLLCSSEIFQPLICDSLKSATETSNGNSGIQTVKRARP